MIWLIGGAFIVVLVIGAFWPLDDVDYPYDDPQDEWLP